MKSGATESCFYYLSQYYKFPRNVDVKRTTNEIIKSDNQYKVIWAHDNCDQAGHAHLPQHVDKIDLIVCVSHWEREQYIKFKRAPAEKLVVIPNGVDDMFRPSGKPKSKTCIFFSAPHKGVAPLVPIWKEVIKHHPDAKLKVFSSMSLYGNIQPGEGENETITTENGLEPSPFIPVYKELQGLPGVEYSPCIDREDLLPHIQDAAFFIHPNVWEETFCVSLAEAMSCGCFPITTGMGALPETSNGMGKYIPMTGQSTPRWWIPDQQFINNFAEEVIRALHFFDVARDEFESASAAISKFAIETYNWKRIAEYWSELIEFITNRVIFDDEYIFDKVYNKNEYGIETFIPDDIVIDIGAHKGYFTKLCLDKGCKNIHSFEPESHNFEELIKNLKDYNYFQAYNLAVLDKKGEQNFSVIEGCNTGLHSFYQTNGLPFLVQKIGLDDILIQFSNVSLLKIDAEGSEFEILYNSKLLHKVKRIVGEYHNDLTNSNFNELKNYLEENNFKVEIITRFNEKSGIFSATKISNWEQTISQLTGDSGNEFSDYYEHLSGVNMVPPQHIDYLYKMKYEQEFNPKVIYDIGSAVLHWSNFASWIWRDSKFYHVDGFDGYRSLYDKKKVDYAIEVLSDGANEVTFYENLKNVGSNSYYEMNYEKFPYNNDFRNEFYRETRRITKPLDTLIREKEWELPDLIKMDIQGCELDVLKGAMNILQFVGPDLILELQDQEYMKGAPMRDEVVQFLHHIGYKLVSHFTENKTGADGDYHFRKVTK